MHAEGNITCRSTVAKASYLRISCLNSCFIKVDFIFSKGRTSKGHSGIMACLAKDSKVWV